MDTIEHLTSEHLNAKARTLAEAVCARGAALVGRTAVAYDAAQAGCAHAGDVEVLEGLLARLLASAAPVRTEEPNGDFYSDRYGDW